MRKLTIILLLILNIVILINLQVISVIYSPPLKAWSGSAFFIDPNGYIVTAAHVVNAAKGNKKYYVYYKEQYYPAKVIDVDEIHDTAILKTNIRTDVWVPVTKDTSDGQHVGVYGFPLGVLNLVYKTGTCDSGSFPYCQLFTHVYSCHGNSGGPVINDKGEAIGLENWIYDTEASCANEGGGPSIKYAINLALENGVPIDSTPKYISMSFKYWYFYYKDVIVNIYGEN